MKIWIDLSNSPHPLLFAPIVRRLETDGHDVLLTARDNAQTAQLALERWPHVEVIGGESPKQRVRKAKSIEQRVRDLRSWAQSHRPDVALSHNSYAQILAAALLRVRIVTAMDFEHQPANHVAFRLAHKILLPEAIPLSAVRGQGANVSNVVWYSGLKEELYIGDFEPDRSVLTQLGVVQRPPVLVLLRTPPSRAIYHHFGNPLFGKVLSTIAAQEETLSVVLTRHREQREAIEALQLPGCIAPAGAIDSRSLMYLADAMIGAGGTMTRESALMRIPTWSVFAGEAPAVDRWLERQGLLNRLNDSNELGHIGPRHTPPSSPNELRARAAAIESIFIATTLGATHSANLEMVA